MNDRTSDRPLSRPFPNPYFLFPLPKKLIMTYNIYNESLGIKI